MNTGSVSTGNPDLSIIVLSWNVRDLLRACLVSVVSGQEPGVNSQEAGGRRQGPDGLTPVPCPPTPEIIVVDNASTDGSADMVAAEFPQVRLIRNAENVGFARGNNIGIAASTGRYVLLLNSDTIVHQGTLDGLIAFMDAHPRAGACSPRLLQPDGEPQAYAFGRDPTPGYLLRRTFSRLIFHRPLHDWRIAETREVDWISGACLLARRATIEEVGGLDEAMFMYFEDNDWCRRMRLAGWQIYYVPTVAIIHIGGAGLKQNPRARAAYYGSLMHFYKNHYGWLPRIMLRILLLIYRPLLPH